METSLTARHLPLLRLLQQDTVRSVGESELPKRDVVRRMVRLARAARGSAAEVSRGVRAYDVAALGLQYMQRFCARRHAAIDLSEIDDLRVVDCCLLLALKTEGYSAINDAFYGDDGPTGAYNGLSKRHRQVRPPLGDASNTELPYLW